MWLKLWVRSFTDNASSFFIGQGISVYGLGLLSKTGSCSCTSTTASTEWYWIMTLKAAETESDCDSNTSGSLRLWMLNMKSFTQLIRVLRAQRISDQSTTNELHIQILHIGLQLFYDFSSLSHLRCHVFFSFARTRCFSKRIGLQSWKKITSCSWRYLKYIPSTIELKVRWNHRGEWSHPWSMRKRNPSLSNPLHRILSPGSNYVRLKTAQCFGEITSINQHDTMQQD